MAYAIGDFPDRLTLAHYVTDFKVRFDRFKRRQESIGVPDREDWPINYRAHKRHFSCSRCHDLCGWYSNVDAAMSS